MKKRLLTIVALAVFAIGIVEARIIISVRDTLVSAVCLCKPARVPSR